MEKTAALLLRLNLYCARALEGAASLCRTRAHADTGARNISTLLNQQILPVLGQQPLAHMAWGQKPQRLTLSRRKEEGISLAFNKDAGAGQ